MLIFVAAIALKGTRLGRVDVSGAASSFLHSCTRVAKVAQDFCFLVENKESRKVCYSLLPVNQIPL